MRNNDTLPPYYTSLFNAVTDAIAALEQGRISEARALLIWGQQRAEDAYTQEPPL